MLKNYLLISLRKLWKQKTFSIINVLGLTLGMTSCMFILMYVGFESSYDNFVEPDVYRIVHYGFEDNVEVGKSAQTVPALSPALRKDLPEIVDAARLIHTDPLMADPVMEAGEQSFRESHIYYADSSFLSMMAYSMQEGSASSALALPNSVVISASTAKKYFNDKDPLGEIMIFHRGERGISELKVTGIFKDIPANSHLHPDFLVSFTSLGFDADNIWDWGNFYNYVKLAPEISAAQVEDKLPQALVTYLGEMVLPKSTAGYHMELKLQPVRSIHLESNLWGETEANGDKNVVLFLAIIALFILIIAWVNYINFSVARSSEHMKEAGIRRMNGSSTFQLLAQSLTESALLNSAAVILSAAALQGLLPLLSELAGLPVHLQITTVQLFNFGALLVFGTLLSGIYPAWLISRHRPIALLKKQTHTSAFSLSKALVVFQFAASIILIVGTLTIRRQLMYMQERDLGVNLEQTLVVKGPGIKDSLYNDHLDYFRNKIRAVSSLDGMAVTSSIPGRELHWGRTFNREETPNQETGIYIIAVDENYFDLMNATFLGGNNFPDGSTTYQDAVILNETAARQLGYASAGDAIGKTITWHENNNNNWPRKVIGVVKDFNQQSLKVAVEPMIFALKKYLVAPWAGEYYTFKLSPANTMASIDEIHATWNEVFPGNPFDYFFLDNFYDAQYRSDRRFGNVFELFAGLAIFIACMGLFGLSTYMAIRRTKEIGVRKVLGSSAGGIMFLLSRNFLGWILLAFIIACPVAWYAIDKWLTTFAYRIEIDVWLFVIAGSVAFLIALVTVSWQTWRAARSNPAEALRYE